MRSDRGTATIALVAVLSITAVIGIGTAGVGLLYAEKERASTAAEAAALAAAVATYPPTATMSPREAAAFNARSNGIALISCRCPVDGSIQARTVTVIVGTRVELPLLGTVAVRSGARAEFDPRAWLGR